MCAVMNKLQHRSFNVINVTPSILAKAVTLNPFYRNAAHNCFYAHTYFT